MGGGDLLGWVGATHMVGSHGHDVAIQRVGWQKPVRLLFISGDVMGRKWGISRAVQCSGSGKCLPAVFNAFSIVTWLPWLSVHPPGPGC